VAEKLTGDAKAIAALLATEARLGVRFPDAYRDFVANRKRYQIVVKRIRFVPVGKTDWLDDSRKAIAIGKTWSDGDGTLCFKVIKRTVSESVYVWEDGAFKRIPAFNELVERERENRVLHDDARTRLAERLGGVAKRCACKRELRVLQVCKCGRIGARTDQPYTLSTAEQAEAVRAYPSLVRAYEIVTALKAAGHAVPTGPGALIATADLLDANAKPAALLAAWRSTGMTIDITAATITTLLRRK
jgi:hypothetical protein